MASAAPRQNTIENTLNIIQELRSQTHTLKRGLVIVHILISAALLALGFLFWEVTQAVEETQITTNTIASCTQPEGACFQRSQERTARLVGIIADADQNGEIDHVEIKDTIQKLERLLERYPLPE